MARNSSTKSGSSKIRFIMLEAELSDGDLSQVTHAIQNALRPTQTAAPRVLQMTTRQDDSDQLTDLDSAIELTNELPEQPTRRTSSTPRKASFRTPLVVDVDLKSSPSLEGFVNEHRPKSTNSKFLAVLAWFKEARAINGVSVDQVYTCFKHLGWSTGIKDFSQPLRDLKAQQLIGGTSKSGFEINHIGLDKVKKYADAK